jgi:hypothetical protein
VLYILSTNFTEGIIVTYYNYNNKSKGNLKMYYEIIRHESGWFDLVTVWDGMDVLRGRSSYSSLGLVFKDQPLAERVLEELNTLVKQIEDLKNM